MATIRKRNGKWQVRIRRTGQKETYRTFHRKTDAQQWARQMEAEADRNGLPANPDKLRKTTVSELIDRYDREVVALKRCAKVESDMLKMLKRETFAWLTLDQLSVQPFVTYRDQRLRTVKPATVGRELGLLQHMFEIARSEWDFPLASNPIASVRKPKIQNRRDRRVTPDELQRLEAEARPEMRDLVQFALETGMRRSELVNIQWSHARLDKRLLFIPHTKNGWARTIPLSLAAAEILERRYVEVGGDGPFQLTTNAVRLSWERLTRRAEVQDLRFHDLRHEAISRFFERGLRVPEVALISGHKDYRMLFRYTHLRPDDLVDKL